MEKMKACKKCAYIEKGDDGRWYCGDCGIAIEEMPIDWCPTMED
jgi:transcription initiation factor TFIIIB Brf1 subunit/transcription initiation factor TFIIB